MSTNPFLCLAAAMACGLASAQVSAVKGRIVLASPAGEVTALTTSGRDSDPWLSPDGKTVLFVRHKPDDVFDTSVYLVDIPSREERLFFNGPVEYGDTKEKYYGRPELDQEQQTLFLLLRGSGTLVALDLASGRARFITVAVGYDVIQCGEHRGELLVFRRQEGVDEHPFFVYWLFSPDGKNLGLAGPDGMDRDRFLDPACTHMREEEKAAQAYEASEAAQPRPTKEPAPLQVAPGEMAHRLRFRVDPVYPAEAMANGIEGTVALKLRIAPDGSVSDAALISGHPQLAQAAMSAVRQWKYEPYTVNGRAVEVGTTVAVPFVLSK